MRLRRGRGPKDIVIDAGVRVRGLKDGYAVSSEYSVHPLAKVAIVRAQELGEGYHYFAVEPSLNVGEYEAFTRILNIMSRELEPPEGEEVDLAGYIYEQAKMVANKYRRSLGKLTKESMEKVYYYVVRNLAGYGPIHPMMLDPEIEDISCNGLGVPVYVWHRRYESIPTNISFSDEQALNNFIVKLAHRSSRHISSAQPLLDAMLPEKHRLAATFMREVSTRGSTFCIRKFRAEPFSVLDLAAMGTLSEQLAAYFWLLLENKMSLMILGGTGAGKTSLLNALLSLMPQNNKIVTVEETPELNPPHANWTQFHTRQSFYFGSSSIASVSLFDLVKMSLRYRPDYIIIGEVRGEEAYVLFQALATGHGGLCTMHSDSIENAVKRLTSPPMNVAGIYIPLMNCSVHIERVELPTQREGVAYGRRIRSVCEIRDYGDYRQVAYWNPVRDSFETRFEESFLLRKIADERGMRIEEILEELSLRERYLRGVAGTGVRGQREVVEKILAYSSMKREERVRELVAAINPQDEKTTG